MKEELLKITSELKAYLQSTDKTLYMGQPSTKNEGKIHDEIPVDLQSKKKYRQNKANLSARAGSEPMAEQAHGSIPVCPLKADAGGRVAEPEASYTMIKKEKINTVDAMKGIFNKVKKCKKCMLGLSRLNPVFGVGSINADVVFVGEGPGFKEDHTGEPFVGRSGQLLDKIFASIDLSRESVYITNIVKCHPMINPETPEAHGNDRPPTPEEISTCRHYLDRQIEIIAPKCIVTLGSVAAKVLLGEKRGISLLRGKWYEPPCELFTFSKNIKILPTYHPAALLRNPNLKKDTWHDMKMLRDFLKKTISTS
ncbi:MAG: uracil-DNA glycosylase [Elusimicrobia bacterium]|nr:uracil-DNA glycosylase [Elusimicrobiota bacterium]